MKKVIIIGASSGIGEALAKTFAHQGHTVGLTARRVDKLRELSKSLPGNTFVKEMDVTKYEEARQGLHALIKEMGGMDIIVLNAGYGVFKADWPTELQTIQVNVTGFAALGNFAFEYFKEKSGGQIVGISSVSANRGHRKLTTYAASKAFISHYMAGLRHRAFKKGYPITVTDVKPGYVATPLTEGNRGMFWVIPLEKAAQQIYKVIMKKKDHAYVTGRWALIGWFMRNAPQWLYFRAQ